MSDYVAKPNTGTVFANDKKTADNQPDYRGDIVLGPELVSELAALVNAGKPAKLDLAGWKKLTKAGKTFISLKAQGEYKPKGGERKPTRTEDDF